MRIQVEGASANNLKNIDVEFGDGLTVVTGVSGSGKTSLVFDTVYHEARRRFLDVFSLGSTQTRLAPASARQVTGLGPAVAVGQNLLNRNPNSTVASATGIHLFLRMLYARFGQRLCPCCGALLQLISDDELLERVRSLSQEHSIEICAPLLQGVAGSHRTLLSLLSDTFGEQALRVDGETWQGLALDPQEPHSLEVVIARLGRAAVLSQLRAALQTAAAVAPHALLLRFGDSHVTFARAPVCAQCGTWFTDLRPVHFGTPCPHCEGRGCDRCADTGLHPQAAAVRLFGLRLPEALNCSVDDALDLFSRGQLPFTAARLAAEIRWRLETLQKMGLGYVTLNRPSPSLSRGEAQRVRLAVALTSRLEDLVHVLDEPTIGQHPADVARLLPRLRELRGPVIYVEHDRLAASVADRAVDLGPGAGPDGGYLLFAGSPAELWQAGTATGRHFSLQQRVLAPKHRPRPGAFLTVIGANLRNLQDIDVAIPLRRLTAITGVSGSGKSTLVDDVLVASLSTRTPVGCERIDGPPLAAVLVSQEPIGRNPRSNPATYTKFSDVLRCLYASATGLSESHFSFNRREGACPACSGMGAVEVQMRYLPSTWIQCAGCEGRRFSDDVLSARVRFRDQMLSIADFYHLTVAEALPLLADDKRVPVHSRESAARVLRALRDVGLGYLALGQPSPTLSGGEAQRVKLAKYLGRRDLSNKLLVLDEPTTGLHPQDVSSLLTVLDRLARSGATLVVVEHNSDVIRAADWVVDLGPGPGAKGGRVLYAGPPAGLVEQPSPTGQALRDEGAVCPATPLSAAPSERHGSISVRGARVHNLKEVDVDFPKKALTVVTGVSGSGKSSLVADVLSAEGQRRYLETLSLYERQSVRETAEALVGSISGLGVAITVGSERRLRYDWRATVGTATELSRHLAILLSLIGKRSCLKCGNVMQRQPLVRGKGIVPTTGGWHCPSCGDVAPLAEPRHFLATTYAAACLRCHGVGSFQTPRPEKLIVDPEKPLCGGALYSPGFFPKGFLCKPFNSGYDMTRALGQRYGFDPETTPWCQMTPEAQRAFLFGDREPIPVTVQSRTRSAVRTVAYPGFYGWIRDWDIGGLYTERTECPDCRGQRLRPEYLASTLGGHNMHQLSEMPLSRLVEVVRQVQEELRTGQTLNAQLVAPSLLAAKQRLGFLVQVGLGYLNLSRPAGTLSAGEAQRVRLAALLGGGLTSLTVLLDEPSRGLHPSELEALIRALLELRDEGNTVIVVEHDQLVIRAADHVVDMGPGPGQLGGQVVARGTPKEVASAATATGAWLRGEKRLPLPRARRRPLGWMEVRGARANNLRGETVRFPLRTLTGVCGVSGSGKSTLVADTLARALAPKRLTTSVAYEPVEPGAHDAIIGAPGRVVLVDQSLAGISSPADFLRLASPLRSLYAESEDAQSLGLSEVALQRSCSACNGRGVVTLDMGFLPSVHAECETCQGTGFRTEAWDVRLRGLSLPEVYSHTVAEVCKLFQDISAVARPLEVAAEVGLGYLVLRQPSHSLSGGEAQRLKIASELCRTARNTTLYILDEPTVGQHLEDVARLVGVLQRMVDDGHTVLVVEHHPHVLASCDWLVEMGPGGGPDGGRVVASGPPEAVAAGSTATAPYLRQVLRT